MKREQFHIKSTVGHNVTKSTWNSSIRAIEKMAKQLAVDTGANYHLTDSESIKEGFYFVRGFRTWTNQKNGCQVVFSINKIAGE